VLASSLTSVLIGPSGLLKIVSLNLVDPDNRRSVNYAFRRQTLDAIRSRWSDPKESVVEDLWRSPQDGRLKMYAIWRTLSPAPPPQSFQPG
jgi:maltooligosyltrehalose synthase